MSFLIMLELCYISYIFFFKREEDRDKEKMLSLQRTDASLKRLKQHKFLCKFYAGVKVFTRWVSLMRSRNMIMK